MNVHQRAFRILVVEDECLIAFDLAEVLTDCGYDVCAIARSADEAVAAAERFRPDLALMDVRLADGSSGLDAAERIRLQFGIASCFLSGSIDRELMEAARAIEPIGFLSKPFQPRLLKRMIANAATACSAVAVR